MSSTPKPKIVSAERLDGGVVISFDDGRTAVYPSALLYDHFGEAQELPSEAEEEESADISETKE